MISSEMWYFFPTCLLAYENERNRRGPAGWLMVTGRKERDWHWDWCCVLVHRQRKNGGGPPPRKTRWWRKRQSQESAATTSLLAGARELGGPRHLHQPPIISEWGSLSLSSLSSFCPFFSSVTSNWQTLSVFFRKENFKGGLPAAAAEATRTTF